MNRVKVWIFTVVVVAAGYFALRSATIGRRAETVAGLDARLAAAAAHVSASLRAVGREASAAGAFVARDAKLASALRATEPEPAVARGKKPGPPATAADPADEAGLREAARQALSAAERVTGIVLPGATVVSPASRESLAQKGAAGPAEGEGMAFLRGAVAGQLRRGFVRQNGALWYGAAVPTGEGAGVLLLVPIDETWARTVATASGADVTLSVPEVKAAVSTARASDAPLLQAATQRPGSVDVGAPAGVDLSFGPIKLPRLPQPVPGGAPLRARAFPLEGVSGAFAIVSVPAGVLDAAAAFHWRGVAGLAVVLLAGFLLGFLVPSTESVSQIPQSLHAAATRIESGDFSARAPPLAGRLGTVAAALNRAAELAGPAQAAQGAPPAAAPVPGMTGEWYQGPLRGAPLAPEPEPPPAPRPTAVVGAAQGGAAAAVAAPSPVAAPAVEIDEEAHWRQVFQDFLRTRSSCGEPTEGLTYERFRQKLDANKAQLVAKYGCKTVRFQVYVKDGKAALKATPVK